MPKKAKHEQSAGNDRLPTVRDFSPSAIQAALKSHATSHFTVRYSPAILVGAGLIGAAFGFNGVIIGLLIAIAAFGGGSFAWFRYLQADSFQLRYVKGLQEQIRNHTQVERRRLQSELAQQGCSRGAEQLEKLQEKFDNLVILLRQKLDESELTYNRYLGLAQEVLLSGIDNLAAVSSALTTISDMDPDRIERQLGELRDQSNGEATALRERLELYQQQRQKIEQMLQQNEIALTQLDKTQVAISDLDTGRGESKVSMEQSMDDLIEITKRSEDYATNPKL
jgi:hypothetical protein